MRSSKNIGLNDIENMAKQIAKKLRGGEILALVGPLGSGKTTFTKALGRCLKVKHKITSPSFRLMHSYKGKTSRGKKITICHLDLYRTKNWGEIKTLGLTEIWQNKLGITIIEWADKIKFYLPKKVIWVKFSGL